MFDDHLKLRTSEITSALGHILSDASAAVSDISHFQQQLSRLQVEQKSHAIELEKTRLEKAQMEERLETASMRYMLAEKKLDRARSMTVAKLERQAVVGGRNEAGSGLGGAQDSTSVKNESTTNGQVDNEAVAESELARKEAVAVSVKQAEQIEKLATDNDALSSQITAFQLRLSRLSDDDYARTDLFKQLKTQHEDTISKMNGLEATNVELLKEVQKYKEERSSYRVQLDTETKAAISERDSALGKAEGDLARIRAARDELIADLHIRKSSQDQEKQATGQIKKALSIREERLSLLEAEVERLSTAHDGVLEEDAEAMSAQEIQAKYRSLEKKYWMINQELSSMSAAYKKLNNDVARKLSNAAEADEKIARLSAEKVKADQKYFAAMKNKEVKDQEIRTLRAQNLKSSAIISELKEAEATRASMVIILEKKNTETEASIASLENKHHAVQSQVKEKVIVMEGLQKQLEDLKSGVAEKDSTFSTVSNSLRKAEVEVERLRAEVKEKDKRLDLWRSKGLGSETEHHEALRVSSIPASQQLEG